MEHRQLGLAPRDHFAVDWAKRDKFVAEYCRQGDRKKAVEAAGITLETAKRWMADKWFQERVVEVKRSLDRQMEHRITHILDETFKAIQERLENGDPKMLRDGSTVRIPVAVRDLTVLAGVMFDKRAALRRDDNPDNGDVASSLEKIANKLRQFEATGASQVLRDAEIVDVEMHEADNSDLV